ncbi:hypothetical protein IGI42_004322 [Enterococcus sp. AZ109]
MRISQSSYLFFIIKYLIIFKEVVNSAKFYLLYSGKCMFHTKNRSLLC